MEKSTGAFRTISEVSLELDVPQHVLRFWEQKFAQIKPLKRGGGRRYYRPSDIDLIRSIRRLLYSEGYTIRGVQRILRTQGTRSILNGTAIVTDETDVTADADAIEADGRSFEGGDRASATEPDRDSPVPDRVRLLALLAELQRCAVILRGRPVNGRDATERADEDYSVEVP